MRQRLVYYGVVLCLDNCISLSPWRSFTCVTRFNSTSKHRWYYCHTPHIVITHTHTHTHTNTNTHSHTLTHTHTHSLTHTTTSCIVALRRHAADVDAYNAVADEVMRELGVPSIDLYSATLALGPDLYCDHVHYHDHVRKAQAEHIAQWVADHFANKD